MLIRPFRQTDMPTARELLRGLGYEVGIAELAARFARLLGAEDHRVAIAEHDGRVAGLAHAFARPALEQPYEAVVQALVVDPAWRGQGIGRALMREAEAWAAARGLPSVALHTRSAQAFYRRLGYRQLATADLMRKPLRLEEG
jgi:GNAT superfamily N-acetyltransferase